MVSPSTSTNPAISLGCGTAKVVRTGEWWLNPLHDYPILRLVERGWWMSHETLDCGHKSLSLVWPEDYGAAPWCPFCMIADQEHIIGEFAARLKSFGTILQGEQAQKAVILMQIEELLADL
jgi:hypothetical protein